MWSAEKKNMLRMIYGDDLTLMSDVVIARDSENNTCQVINQDGELLVEDPVYGIGHVLGPHGFNYVVLTEKKEIRANESSRPVRMSRQTYNRFGIQTSNDRTLLDTSYVEYTYKIFNSKFEYESVGKARTRSIYSQNVEVNVLGKSFNFDINGCILSDTSKRRNAWL